MDIINEILTHVQSSPYQHSNWYVGIATDARTRLFQEHNVSEHNGWWIHRDCGSEKNARVLEKYLLDNYSFLGGTGGGVAPRHIYAYVITASTQQ